MLHGVTSFHDETTPTWGLSQSASVIPIARSIARAGALVGPSVTSKLRIFSRLGPPVTWSSLTAAQATGSSRLTAKAIELRPHLVARSLAIRSLHDLTDEEP